MLTYKAAYRFVDGGVHAEVLDFPGAITCAANLPEARELLAGALVDVAETLLMLGQALPVPDPSRSDPEADLEEPLHLVLEAGGRVQTTLSRQAS